MTPYDIKQKLQQFGLTPNRALGQNFLADESHAQAIARLACKQGLPVLEIGPGLGALTTFLLDDAPHVAAVEIDARLIDVLKLEFENNARLTLIHGDFLKTDPSAITSALSESFAVAANLPYYITTPICMRLLAWEPLLPSFTLMLQKEAAGRFFAPPRSRAYSPLTVLANLYYEVQPVLELPPHAYYPQPAVDSSVIHLSLRPNAQRIPGLSTLLDAAFAMRRKTLVNNLKQFGLSRNEAETILTSMSLSPAVRAEELTPDQFCQLADALLKEE